MKILFIYSICTILEKCYVTNPFDYMLKIASDPFSDKHYTNMAISSAFQSIVLRKFDQHCQYFQLSLQGFDCFVLASDEIQNGGKLKPTVTTIFF